MKTILISNRKGGSGKSTTAVNLAAQLVKKHSVLLIDFDTQGHAGVGVGGIKANVGTSIGVHEIFNGAALSSTLTFTQVENLILAPASGMFNPSKADDRSDVLKNCFANEKAFNLFEYCIIDTAPTYDILLKNGLEVADCVVIPVVPHELGVIAVDQMFSAIYQMSLSLGRRAPMAGILPVMYNPHIPEHKKNIQKIANRYGIEKLFLPIRNDLKLAIQFEKQKPLIRDEKRARGAQDYKTFVKALKKRMHEELI